MSEEKNKSFKTYDEAIDKFARITSDIEMTLTGLILSQYSAEQTIKLSNQASKNLFDDWFKKCKNLSTPWPENKMIDLLSIKTSRNRMGVVLNWCRENKDTQNFKYFKKVLKMGMNPTSYIPSSAVTPLGFCVYSLSSDAVDEMLKHTSPPASRLILLRKHMESNPDEEMEKSTLLHRIGSRYTYIVKDNKEKKERFNKIIKAIAKHDIKCFSLKTKKGKLPEELATGDAAGLIQNIRRQYEDKAALKKKINLKNKKPGKNKIF